MLQYNWLVLRDSHSGPEPGWDPLSGPPKSRVSAQMLKKWDLLYPTWRWWHASMQHGKAIGYCTSYQMYKESVSVLVLLQWKKVDKPMSEPQFQDKLAKQQCGYQTVDVKYPGDKQINACKQQSKTRREARIIALEESKDGKE